MPRPWQPAAPRANRSTEVAEGDDACLSARYVRLWLRADGKRDGLADETVIVKEVVVLPLQAMVDGETASLPSTADVGDDADAGDAEASAVGAANADGTSDGSDAADTSLVDAMLPEWAPDVLPLLRDGFRFEAIGVGGLDTELSQLFRRVVTPRLVPAALRGSLNLQLVRGVLLHGPPGTGKTLTARKIGSLLKVPEERTTVVDGPALVSKFLGESEKNMRDLFAAAIEDQQKARARSSGSGSSSGRKSDGGDASLEAAERLHVIIFDEIDAICRSRGHAEQAAGIVYDSLVNQLLSIMDGVTPLDNVLLIGMTNRRDLIDPALLRPGRFEVELSLTLPSLDGREQILRIHTRQLQERSLLAPGLSLLQVARDTSSFSGAALAGLIKSATSLALARIVHALPDDARQLPASNIQLTSDDFGAAIREVRQSRGLSRQQLRRLRGPLLVYSNAFEQAWDTGVRLLTPLAAERDGVGLNSSGEGDDGRFGRVASILISGEAGSGRTAFAAGLASHTNFSYVGVVSADQLRGASEQARLEAIQRIGEDAFASDTAVVLLDDVERLLGHVSTGEEKDGVPTSGTFSASTFLIEAVLALLRTPPPAGCSLMIMATTAVKPLLGRTALLAGFDSLLSLPKIAPPEDVHALLRLVGAAGSEEELHGMQSEVPAGATLKQIMRAVELSRPPPPPPPVTDMPADAAGKATAIPAMAAATVSAAGESETSQTADPPPSMVDSELGGGEGSPLMSEPLEHRPIDRQRFRELLQRCPVAELQAAHATKEKESFVHVVNSTAELEEQRWSQEVVV